MNEFTGSRVPDDQTTSGWRIALIKIGIVIALPGFLTGAEIGFQLGLANAAVAVIGGCLVLAALCSLTGTVAAKSRLPTAVITQFAFGRVGAKMVNLILAITLIGWFAVTLELFADTLGKIFTATPAVEFGGTAFVLGGGLLMMLTTIFGFKALTKLSNLAVPLMFLVLVVMAYLTAAGSSLEQLLSAPGGTTSLGFAISAVVGGPAAGTVIFPDIARFARSPNHGRVAACISYGVGMPLILLLVGITAIATGEKDLVMIMLGLGLGVPALIFLIFTAWTTNAGNLYSGSLFLSTILFRLPHNYIVVIGGILGICFALFGLTDHFIPFLVALGIAVPPIAGIYVTDFFLRGQKLDIDELSTNSIIRVPAFICWGCGIVIALMSARGLLTITSVPACDSILVSASLFFVIKHFSVLLHKSKGEKSLASED